MPLTTSDKRRKFPARYARKDARTAAIFSTSEVANLQRRLETLRAYKPRKQA